MKKLPHFGTPARIATAFTAVAIAGSIVLTKPDQTAKPSIGQLIATAQPTVHTLARVPTNLSARERLKRAKELSQESVEELSSRFQDSPLKQRSILADALAIKGTGKAILELLTQILSEPDLQKRRALAEALKNLTHRDGLETLMSANAATQDPTVLRQVIEAAGRLATPESVEFLVSLYRGDAVFPGQLRTVAKTLSQVSSPEAARMLGTIATTATEPGLIEAVAHGLAKIDNPASLQRLVDTIEHVGTGDTSLRQSLLLLLNRLHSPESAAYRNQLLAEPLPADVLHALQTSSQRRTS